jgi:hypothetical protein
MTDHPTTRNGLSSPTRDAIAALAAFGTTLTREQAADLLPMWARYATLGTDDRTETLNHFPSADDLAALAALAHRAFLLPDDEGPCPLGDECPGCYLCRQTGHAAGGGR